MTHRSVEFQRRMHVALAHRCYIGAVPSNARSTRRDVPDVEASAGEVSQLDLGALALMLRERREDAGLSIRQAAAAAEVSFMTLSRVESGSQPDLTTFLRLCSWLHVRPDTFFVYGSRREPSTVETVTRHLAADPRLKGDAAARISSMVKDLYAALASEPAARPAVACHLRAASVLRPGVPDRLGGLLKDMQARLQELDAVGAL
jgi:transcriptional regulator with XRE-family HTH domain